MTIFSVAFKVYWREYPPRSHGDFELFLRFGASASSPTSFAFVLEPAISSRLAGNWMMA